MQARDTLRQRLCAMHRDFLCCPARVVQPAAEPHPFGPAIGRRSQIYRDAFNGAPQQQRPLLASRASPKRPTDQSFSSINAVIPLADRTERNQTRFPLGKKNRVYALAHEGEFNAFELAGLNAGLGRAEAQLTDLLPIGIRRRPFPDSGYLQDLVEDAVLRGGRRALQAKGAGRAESDGAEAGRALEQAATIRVQTSQTLIIPCS